MDIHRLFSALRRRIWIMILMAVLGAGAASAFVYFFPVVFNYQADSSVYIMNVIKEQDGKMISTEGLFYNRSLVQNYGELIKSRRVTDEALRNLQTQGIVINEKELNKAVVMTMKTDSDIMVVSTTWSDPQIAAIMSNAVSGAFVNTLNELTNSNSVGILDQARPPLIPLSTTTASLRVLIGLLAGFLIGFGIIYIQELLDTTVRTIEEIEEDLNLKVIGIIPEHQIK
ncbi:MAG: Wzz/FepE/Etk N-terminal domain-containing protein [Syntrophomonas sp.]